MANAARILAACLTLTAAVFATPVLAAQVLDCPLRDAPFSAESPLIDLLLNPQAKAIVGKAMGALDKAPPQFLDAKVPAFAAILTLRSAGAFLGVSADALNEADSTLRTLRVTDADRAARCARYDDDRIAVPKTAGPKRAGPKTTGKAPRLLVFEKINGFKDTPGFDAAHALFLDLARKNGWSIVTTDRGGAIRAETLRHFDAVIWNNISGDVLTLTQRRALQDYLEGGGGFLAVHGAAGDPAYFWDWYADTLIGARFKGHPMAPQFQDATIKVEASASPLAKRLPARWTMNDEWYSFSTNPRKAGATVLATLDESTYSAVGMGGQDLRMGDHPIAWSNCIGKGRMFYSAIGHKPETYSEPEYRTMLENALAWITQRKACAVDARGAN